MSEMARGKTAQAAHEDTTRIAGRLFWAPAPLRMVLPILGLSLFGGLLLTYPARIETSIWDLLYRAIFVCAIAPHKSGDREHEDRDPRSCERGGNEAPRGAPGREDVPP